MRKYKMFRFPMDAWDKWFTKKKKIEERIRIKTNKNVNVSMADVVRFYGQQQRFEWDDNVIPYFIKKRKGKNKMGGQII